MLDTPWYEDRESAVNITNILPCSGDFGSHLAPEGDKGPENTAATGIPKPFGPYAASLFNVVVPVELITEWHGNVLYNLGRHKVAIPRNVWERVAEHCHESFEIFQEGK